MSKEAMRRAMPVTAAIVDDFRPWLEKVVYAEETGRVIDKREPVDPEAVFPIPPNYYPCRVVQAKEKK